MAEMRVGDILLVGVHAQAFLSRAIKLGSILRYQPKVARAATIAQLLPLIAAVILAVLLGWSLLGALAALVVALVLGIVLVWVVAAVGGDHSAPWARYSHAALVTRVDRDGSVWLTEALAPGVVERRLHYSPANFMHVPTHVEGIDVPQVQVFAAAVVAAKTRYGVMEFAGLAVYCVSSSLTFAPTVCLQQAGTAICSGFVADALTRAGFTWRYPPYWMMPADLAAHFEVM